MQFSNSNNGHTYLMIATMAVLTVFLCYWLKAEYENEWENIGLEQKVDYIEDILTDIEIDSIFNAQSVESVLIQKRQLADSLTSKKRVKDIVSIHLDGVGKLHTGRQDGNDLNAMDPMDEPSRWEEELLEAQYMGITSTMVLKRMIPQFIIALLLLGSVLTTFLVLRRTLRKQARLAEIKDDFVANMTHELKTPISTIGVALEALKDFGADQNPSLRREYMDITLSEVNRLGMLVDKALSISLFEKGEATFEHQRIDLSEMVDTINRTLRIYHEQHHIEIDIQKEGQEFAVAGDPTHMMNIIHNLIENAIKYSPEDVKISLLLEARTENVLLHIRDNGIGIGKVDMSRIFEKFYRVSQGNIHNTKGHGLGLSYVKMAVEKMGGTIAVESKPHQGSTFSISFPKYTA